MEPLFIATIFYSVVILIYSGIKFLLEKRGERCS